MRYTKPNVLTTVDANRAIQTHSHPNAKIATMADNAAANSFSTTGAYEADE
ncbi:hypothetical protein [Granulicella sp. L60]|uniref:hypothetical protein n=1 Tax=Granulicella sp. L60 TaxID=1641866 RepID=UPI00131A985D|nr:hypothetical protein [Granulicella sp. L60]